MSNEQADWLDEILQDGYIKSHVFDSLYDAELWQAKITKELTSEARQAILTYLDEAIDSKEEIAWVKRSELMSHENIVLVNGLRTKLGINKGGDNPTNSGDKS